MTTKLCPICEQPFELSDYWVHFKTHTLAEWAALAEKRGREHREQYRINTDTYECPQCVGRRDTWDCSWCGNTGIIPYNNNPGHPDWRPGAPHSFYPLIGDLCECGRDKDHPIHSGTQKAKLERPLIAA